MDGKARLFTYVKAVLRRLRFEQFVYTGQTGLFVAILLAVLMIAATRLFVLPHYKAFALGAAGLALVVTIIYLVTKRSRPIEAIRRLDRYMPDNLLLTAMGVDEKDTHLAPALIQAAESEVAHAFEGFKKRRKAYLNALMLAGIIGLSAVLVMLLLIPSEAQLEADAIAKEQEIIEEMKQDVHELIAKETLPDVKKELLELTEKLQQAETSEEALKELVKKQKEMRLKEKRLAERKEHSAQSEDASDTWAQAEEKELDALGRLSDELAKNAGKAHTALNHIGKAPSLPALANAENSPSAIEEGETDPSTEVGSGENQSDGNGQGVGEQEAGMGNESEQGEGQGEGQSQGQGQGQTQGEGTGQSEEQGLGQAQGQSQGSVSGGGGSGAGKGSGGRNLLSIPHHRIGEKGDPSVVDGNLGEGEFIEERETEGPVERGTVRPYQEVVGQYKESYLQSTDRMKLPPDLQHILSDYFSSIE
ncbi:hypothetical protein MHZ95_02915 [Sporosarcina sp. ACRSM]|uniref:hypothetical protein n=1 Tax=Sporosarcina sp. ACRSM TaxID=2918216 RepID=UPI001EF69155|nr:hypothetical protein [Sporosarcina sp. ACRSM]MCG7334228.1 hypothetical protein [Sporosarcina sp. ACRSM]